MIVGSSGVGIAEVGPHREQGNFWRGGVWQQGWANYFFEEMQVDWPQLDGKLSDAERAERIEEFPADKFPEADISQETYASVRMHLPMVEIGKEAKAPDTELEEYLARGPSDPVWAEDRVTDKDVIKVPGLWAEALYDISPPSAVAFFEKTRKENPAGHPGHRDHQRPALFLPPSAARRSATARWARRLSTMTASRLPGWIAG